MNFAELLLQLDTLIRNGAYGKVRKTVLSINKVSLPDEYRSPLAHIARRAGMPKQVLLILRKYFGEDRKLSVLPTAEQKALYAYALARLGALQESGRTLRSVKKPDAWTLLFRSRLEMMQWNYWDACSLLESYLKIPGLPKYDVKVAKINLLASAIGAERWTIVHELEAELFASLDIKFERVLYGNLLELATQHQFLAKNYLLAREHIQKAETLLLGTSSASELFMKKWKRLVDLYEFGREQDFAQLVELRAVAIQVRQWEVVRDIDFHLYAVRPSRKLFENLYYGTPFESYRQRVLSAHSTSERRSQKFMRHLGEAEGEGEGEGSKVLHAEAFMPELWQESRHAYQLFLALNSDFYRPISEGQIFETVFPGERYDVMSTRKRLRFHVYKLREILLEIAPDLKLVITKDGYQLQAPRPHSIWLSKQRASKLKVWRTSIERLEDSRWYSGREIAQVFSLSEYTCAKVLQEAIAANQLQVRRQGKMTRYRKSPNAQKAKAA